MHEVMEMENSVSREAPRLEQWGDADLQLSRRLDWRFLLPDPRLRRVAYVGAPESTLLAALRRFCDSVVVISCAGSKLQTPTDLGAFDLLVVNSGDWSDVTRASALLAGGGYLYWEVDRWAAFRRSADGAGRAKGTRPGKRPGLQDCLRSLEGLGLSSLEVHWHYPDFERCRKIIPLNEGSALEYLLARRRGSLLRRATAVIGSGLVRSGLLRPLAPCISIVGRRREVPTGLS